MIEPVWKAAGHDIADWDQAVARMVVSGEIEMGLIPARAWDTEGVDSFRALHAPFLIASDSLLADVVSDPFADEMLAGLGEIGLTGLALAPEGLRHVFSFGEPLLAPCPTSTGSRFASPTSATTHALFEALGAAAGRSGGPRRPVRHRRRRPAPSRPPNRRSCWRAGLPAATTATGNVALFPKVNSLVINTEAYDGADRRAAGDPRRGGAGDARRGDRRPGRATQRWPSGSVSAAEGS